MEATGVYDIRQLIQFGQYPAQHLQVIDLDIHIDSRHHLFGIAAAGNAQYVNFLICQDRSDIAQ